MTVRATGSGTLISPAVDLTSSLATATAASATLTVNAAAAPDFAKVFSPATVDLGGVSRLTFTIEQCGERHRCGLSRLRRRLPGRLGRGLDPQCDEHLRRYLRLRRVGGPRLPSPAAASRPGKAVSSPLTWWLRGPGALTGTSSDLTSDLPVDAPGVEATLTVNKVPLSVSMSFEPLTIGAGGVSRLTYVLRNGARVAATSVTLSDTLPTGVVVADPPDARTTCAGGTLTAAAGRRRRFPIPAGRLRRPRPARSPWT